MQRKLKSVFRRSSKSKRLSGHHEQLDDSDSHPQKTSSSGDRRRVSSDQRGGNSIDSSATGSVYTGRSRPVSSTYNDSQNQASGDLESFSGPNGGAIANDYKAYLPALSPVNDDHGDEYMTFSNGNQGKHSGSSGARHEEDVANRNTTRYSSSVGKGPHNTLVANSTPHERHSQVEPTIRAKSPTEKYSVTPGADELGSRRETGKPHLPDVDRHVPRSYEVQETQSGVRHATLDGTAHGEETALARELRESGVADLRNTVDTDGDVKWARAVTHEVIKPHQHEIVQHKIYREIHNYEHFHRIQPVMMTEVLPPRHWIPNPDGEGLVEVSADQLPARTGENRWWSICEHSSPYSLQTALPKYRTEPEIIDAGTFMTKEGFERKETIVIHPPTLADLTGYGGPVQAMHFDHKTGKSWIGELTTMSKLHQLQQELDRAPDAQTFKMDGLAKALPSVPPASGNRSSNSVPSRKPVNPHSPTVIS